MDDYKLIMFFNDDKIYVMEVGLDGHTKHVGFQGEDYFHYNRNEDIDDFYKNLTDTYNVDVISELDTNIFLIDCGMESKAKWFLIDKLKTCECLNINSISCLLPILLAQKGLLQVGQQIVVEFLGKKYAYIFDNEYHIEELLPRGKKVQKILNMEDFSFIARWEGVLSNGTNSELNEEFEKAQEAWTIQKNNYEEKIKALDNRCKDWEEKYTQVQKELNELVKERHKSISNEMISRRRLVIAKVGYDNRIIVQNVKSGELVNVNQEIGYMICRRDDTVDNSSGMNTLKLGITWSSIGGLYQNDDKIYAPREGKLIWLPLNGDVLYKDEIIGEYKDKVVGVIGDKLDDEDDMIKWAKSKADK